ncbi:uncharacterized protein LOC127860666 [Dreissena polymorpha]|uniref:B box-type domain-containing protein n=1 Tax=Dreissena polymorpha TaxID=45954 RepID=A0A9D4BRP7_DREPO|nr:uncharacterized protein LOC127860666 [Dreissena polymorpha]KAH3702827.1 hypothetical protein DPMN_077853 [Dreissena polymorpha]
MATFSQSTVEKGSDMVQDFLCSTCKDRKLEKSAEYYCETCVQFYCGNCIHVHGQLFTEHSPHGRGDMKKWPVAKKVEDFLLKCDVHKEENMEMFCKDHSQLCCRKCDIISHRKCQTVILLSDLVKTSPTDLKQVSVTIHSTLAELMELQNNQESSIRSVQSSFEEQLHKIQESREKIIAALSMLEKKTLTEMKDKLTQLQALLKGDRDECATFRDEFKQLRDAIQDVSDKGKQELSFIASFKCKDKIQQFEKYRKKNLSQKESSITFQPNNEIVQYLSSLSGLGMIEHSSQPLTVRGNPDQVIRIDGKSEYDVRLRGDSSKESKCCIRDICVLPSGQILIADSENQKIKLLNQQFQVVSHCNLSDQPRDMCQITPSEVGVTYGSNIHFIKVNNSQLWKVRKLQVRHDCEGITYHEGDLLVTTGTALYKYWLTGKLVRKLHQDISNINTVWRCAVSRTGDRLYITNSSQSKLITLTMDGSVLATFEDPDLISPTVVHVTPAGQVLVCGEGSSTILQVDSMGTRKLATLATDRDGLKTPYSVCYNSNTASIIVGMWRNDMILVYKVE